MTLADATILDACASPSLFARWFRRPDTWRAWFVFLRALFAIEMSEEDRQLYESCTGRAHPPEGGSREAWLICGRRSGKSMVLALIAVFLACFRDWSEYLSPGERGTVMIIATDRRQARTIFRYVAALLRMPALAALVENETAEAIDLTNGISIEILTASFRSVRGYTLVAALLDEVSFWRNDESANPDSEVLAALRPAMSTVPGSMLLCASSPYARRGILWDAYRRHFGKDGAALVWKAPTRVMNPTVPQSVIDEAAEADPANAAAEYGAEFRSDVEAFITREVVDAVTVLGRRELPPVSGTSYVAFCDPSGGSSDSMTLAIAHKDRDTGRGVLDVVRERKPPFSPHDVVAEFAELLRDYRLRQLEGDKYGGDWVAASFREHNITYAFAAKAKSDLYRELLPLLNSNRVELLDHPRLVTQLCGLERRTARSGRDAIDHAPGAHDDLANAAAGALVKVVGTEDNISIMRRLGGGDGRPPRSAPQPVPVTVPAGEVAAVEARIRARVEAEFRAATAPR